MQAPETRAVSSPAPIIKYMPGFLPSGWSKLTHGPVLRRDGATVMTYSGFELLVTVVHREGVAEIQVTRSTRGGRCTEDDISRVVDGLYRRSPLRHQMQLSAKNLKVVTTFRFLE